MLDLGPKRVTLPTVCAWPLARAYSPGQWSLRKARSRAREATYAATPRRSFRAHFSTPAEVRFFPFSGETAPTHVEPTFRPSRRDEAQEGFSFYGVPSSRQMLLCWLVASTDGRNRALNSSAERFEYAASRESDGSSKSSGSSLIM